MCPRLPNSMSDDTFLTQPNSVIAEEHQLHRALGPVSLIMIGIGSIIGAGIFVIAGTAAAEHAGPAVILSFVIAGSRLPLRRALLRRIRLDDSGIRQRLHLRLRHDGPLHGVVHRLEHGARISHLGIGGRGRLVGLFRELPAGFRLQLSRRLHQCAGRGQRPSRSPSDGRRHQSSRDIADRVPHGVSCGGRE